MVDHLFRHESGKMVSVLTRVFGPENLELAEDVVQDSLLEALHQWQFKGLPENPSAWLFRVAKNKALNILNRHQYKRKYESAIRHAMKRGLPVETNVENDADIVWDPVADPVWDGLFTRQEVQDDQLRMIFTCCHPCISADSQIALALKTLCGFSIAEIARAFITTEENISKRLKRARQSIRDDSVPFDIPQGKELDKRLAAVLETIYLLFNEGYSASTGDDLIRYELCEEAIRLARIVLDDRNIRQKETVHALLALMYLNASRFRARQDQQGNLVTLAEQDRSLWDTALKNTGVTHLQQASVNDHISIYSILAMISAHYSMAPSFEATDWKSILTLYDNLVAMDPSPLIRLNRAIVLAKLPGPGAGPGGALEELKKIQDDPAMKDHYLFYSTRAEFHQELKENKMAAAALEKAAELAPIQSIRELLEKRLSGCKE